MLCGILCSITKGIAMLNQKINLYQDRFRKKIIILSVVQMLAASLVLVVALASASIGYTNLHAESNTRNLLALEQKQQLAERLQDLRKKLDSLLANNQVNDEINQVSKDIAVRQHMIDFVTHNQFGSGLGFSENLGELSAFNIKDVWLSEVILGENFMKLSGSALNAEKVPEYFNLLRSREQFEGQVFDVFEVGRTQPRDWKVDFVIASSQERNE